MRRFDTEPAPDIVYRIGRRPDVWAWRSRDSAGPDGTFGNRWDDPRGQYRVLYTSGDRFGAYVEVLAPFRPDLELLAELRNIRKNDASREASAPPGRLPARWRHERLVGSGVCDGVRGLLVAVSTARSLATIRKELAAAAIAAGLDDVNAAVIRLRAPRRFTQDVSRFVYDQVDAEGQPYGGIAYRSQYADDVMDYALFERFGEPFPVTHLERRDIEVDDEDFLRACELLRIEPE